MEAVVGREKRCDRREEGRKKKKRRNKTIAGLRGATNRKTENRCGYCTLALAVGR